ncbi:uncharacterized protein LOC124916255 [Impatiens glandulifera]|uniref:uncharacterized protein LOC124916255 n=1 Tax=Impatiens glandulifera TaxID=253017 RepID=UPI001FB0F1B4|nr:uncharacterized protein LOC124916255 [Impatiens glandulifera]
MSGVGGFTVSRTRGADRFYNPQVRRQQRLLLQQQQKLNTQVREQTVMAVVTVDTENRTDSDDTAAAVALSKLSTLPPPPPPCSSPPPPPPPPPVPAITVTNLDRLVESVTPLIPVQHCPEANVRGRRTGEAELRPFYSLGDLWNSFSEWSAYGAGVPLLLNGVESVTQYYVPFLSGIQLYEDKEKSNSRCSFKSDVESSRDTSRAGNSDREADRQNAMNMNCEPMNSLSLRETDICSSPGTLLYEYLEREQPYNRRPLADKISSLASQFPELTKCRSCDLSPASWISVAWYPIYRIPVGSTLKDLDASFLTFHSLSTHSRSYVPARYHIGVEKTISRVSLPVFGLASYKYKDSAVISSPECEKEKCLLEAADKWLNSLEVVLPDYQFFRSHYYSQWR